MKHSANRFPADLSDCFAQMVLDVSDMLCALRNHYGEPEADAANDV